MKNDSNNKIILYIMVDWTWYTSPSTFSLDEQEKKNGKNIITIKI